MIRPNAAPARGAVSALPAFERQIKDTALVGRVCKPAIWPDHIAWQHPFKPRQDTEQNRFQQQPRGKGKAKSGQHFNHQRTHKTPGVATIDSVTRINHSSETVL